MVAGEALRTAASRLRHGWRLIVETTGAATVAWLIAHSLLGHPQPFFAPAAALIVLGQARGQRLARAVEVVIGVAAGVLVADLVAQALGPRNAWTVLTIILITMSVAVAIGASTILLVQATVSALYVAVVTPVGDNVVPLRFVDALVGGGVAIVANWLARPRNPLAPLAGDVRQIFEEVAAVLEAVADALERHDEHAAREVLTRARRADATVDQLRDAVPAARESLWVDVHRRQRLTRVGTVDSAVAQLDYLVRNVRVLARAGVGLTRLPTAPPPQVVAALRILAAAVRTVERSIVARLAGDEQAAGHLAAEAGDAVVESLRTASQLLHRGAALPVVMIVGQLRASALDLLRSAGGDDVASLGLVDEALGLPAV